jgi:hypothetical protein
MNARCSRDLFIVARADAALHTYLSRYFAGRPDVDVISDRRCSDRRRSSEFMLTERRLARRRLYSAGIDLATLGVAIVTVRR